ncbi:MAG TPA: fumarate reductase subunit FrdD [Burkholderiales bacterium]|nr:fumarate reductase subunit FrdD [Burkholderiales bacterium]
MAKSNKPIIWGLFAAGGTVTAFVMPVLVVLTLLAALGHAPELLAYDKLHGFAAHWSGKAVLFGIIFLSLWHAAHRLRITLHDFGVRSDTLVAFMVYLAAAFGSVATAIYLLQI